MKMATSILSRSTSMNANLGPCSICKEPLTSDVHSTTCGHIYHGTCIKKWLQASDGSICPFCRTTIDEDKLIKIFPGISQRIETPMSTDLLNESELKALTIETCRGQSIIYHQIKLLQDKMVEQGDYIETLKGKLEDKGHKLTLIEADKTKLGESLREAEISNEDLKTSVEKITLQNTVLSDKLEENDVTTSIMTTLAEEHKADVIEATKRVEQLELDLEEIQETYGAIENALEKIEMIRYEVENEHDQAKPVEDFVEDLIAKNITLEQAVKKAEKKMIGNECKILDLEMYVSTLRQSLKEINNTYIDQSEESKSLEGSLRTMQRLHQQQTEEIEELCTEREVYQADIKNMLEKLRNHEKSISKADEKRRQSDAINETYHVQLSETMENFAALKKEKMDALMMVELKEDVIKTLQRSIENTTNIYLNKLDRLTNHDTLAENLQAGSSSENTYDYEEESILLMIEEKFKHLSSEIDKKDDLVIHLMNEKDDIQNKLEIQDSSKESEDEIEKLNEQVKTLEQGMKVKQNSLEESELVINHLVSVVSRYAYSDKDAGTPNQGISRGRNQRNSVPEPTANNNKGSFFSRMRNRSMRN